MEEHPLHPQLVELHQELRAVKAVDPETRELLEQLAADIHALIEAGPALSAGTGQSGTRDRLGSAVARLEGEHPRLAKALGDLVDTLVLYNL